MKRHNFARLTQALFRCGQSCKGSKSEINFLPKQRMGHLFTLVFTLLVTHSSEFPTLRVVKTLDQTRFAGEWYEIASTRGLITSECTCTRTRYELLDDRAFSVFNSCNKFGPSGPLVTSRKVSQNFNKNVPGLLWEKSWWGLVWEQFRIIEVGSQYEYAVVSDARGQSISVLTRALELDPEVYSLILLGLWSRGVDADSMTPTMHHDCNYPK